MGRVTVSWCMQRASSWWKVRMTYPVKKTPDAAERNHTQVSLAPSWD